MSSKCVITAKNRSSEVTRVNTAFEDLAEQWGIPREFSRKVSVIFDELLVNIISCAYQDEAEHDIIITVGLSGNLLRITIEDDGIPFNPFGVETPDTKLPMEERKIGGLGIHLIRNMVDETSYQRRIDRNVVTFVKHLEVARGA